MSNLSIEEQILADLEELDAQEKIEQAKYVPLIVQDSKLLASEEWKTWRREAQKKKKAEENRRAYAKKRRELLATGYDPKLFDGRIKIVTVKKMVIVGRKEA